MKIKGWYWLLVASVVCLGGVTAFYLVNNEAVAPIKKAFAKKTPTKNTAKAIEFSEKYKKQLANLQDNADFYGGGDADGDFDHGANEIGIPRAASGITPGTISEVINGIFVVNTPDITEEELHYAAVIERLEYTLGNLQSEVLDAIMGEYLGNHGAVLFDMGITQHCAVGGCGFQIQEGAFLSVASQAGVQKGDTVLTINNVSIGDIPNYVVFKEVVFSNTDSIQLIVDRVGTAHTLEVPIKR